MHSLTLRIGTVWLKQGTGRENPLLLVLALSLTNRVILAN